MKLDESDFENLGFVIGRTYLRAQLSSYQSGWGKHKERAFSFFQAVSVTKNKTELHDLVTKQVAVLQDNNPYKLLERNQKYKTKVQNPTLDKYHGIIGFWQKMMTDNEVAFDDEQSTLAKKCIIQ